MATPGSEIKRLGRYDIESVLGKGAMGVVYAGLDPRLHRKVAIKTILKSSLDEDTAKEYTMRFDREAQAVARLNHPNIVQVYDFGSEGEVAYIVMEFIQGKELKDFFDANERFDIKEAVHIMGELCDALHFAHEAGIVHRDIKPANVMIDNKGRVKLADFGVARITDADRADSEKTQAGAIVGTPAYMSPEQIEGGEIDRRTDIFSAGIILFQFLTGEKPFTGTSTWTIAKKILQDNPPAPSTLNKSISPLFDAVINKALSKDRETRYQTARDLGTALKNALEGRAEGEDESDKTVVGSLSFDAPSRSPAPSIAAASSASSNTHAGQATGTQEVELEFWRSIKDGNDADDFDLYVKQFPEGIYAALAQRKSAKLRGIASEETTTKGLLAAEQEKKEIEEAARREAEAKAKLAEEKAKLEQQMEQREAAFQKKAAEAEAKREAAAKAKAEAEAREKSEFEAKLAKREADLQVQLKRQEEELKKKEAETVHLAKEIRKKKGSPLVPIAIGLLVAAIGGGGFYFFGRDPGTAELVAALELAKKSNEQLVQARQAEQGAAKALELARQAEAEAKASGDVAKQQQLAEQTRLREAELQKQADLVKQREEEAKKAIAAADAKATTQKDAEAKKKAAEEQEKRNKAAADRAAQEKAATDKVAADKAAVEKAAADKVAAEETVKKAAADKVAADKAAAAAAARAKATTTPTPTTQTKELTAAQERAADRAAEKAVAEKAAADAANKEAQAAAKVKKPVSELPPEKIERVGRIEVAASDPNLLLLKEGKTAETSGDAKEAIKLYRQAYRNGSGEAAKLIGDIYVDGKGNVQRDYAESLVWYTRAEKRGVQVDRARSR